MGRCFVCCNSINLSTIISVTHCNDIITETLTKHTDFMIIQKGSDILVELVVF